MAAAQQQMRNITSLELTLTYWLVLGHFSGFEQCFVAQHEFRNDLCAGVSVRVEEDFSFCTDMLHKSILFVYPRLTHFCQKCDTKTHLLSLGHQSR